MRPRAQGPSDGEGKRREFDAAWDEVLAPGSLAAARPAEEPRPAVEDAPADAGPRVAESSSVDLPTATLEQESAQPDDRVERAADPVRDDATMMSGSWAMATRDASAPSSAAGSASNLRVLRDSDAEMAALMGARRSAADAAQREPSSERSSERSSEASSERSSERSSEASSEPTANLDEPPTSSEAIATPQAAASDRTQPSEPAPTRPKTGPAGIVRPAGPGAPRRMHSPEPRRITARTSALELGAKPRRLSLGWAVVAGIVIAGVAWLVGGPSRRPAPVAAATEPKPTAPTDGGAAGGAKPSADDGGALDGAALARSDDPPRIEAPHDRPEAKRDPVPPKPVVAPPSDRPRPTTRDVRTPPPGTPADIAATFARLPVSPADLPPVGGVGNSGIHIDRIDMGASYDNKSGCVGVATEFSLAANDELNVCVRVVHPRQEEVMSIVWQKNDGSTARRGKIAVKPIHAYRTRAYLRLRAEYIGAWTVRIQSPDGVELASHAFTITP